MLHKSDIMNYENSTECVELYNYYPLIAVQSSSVRAVSLKAIRCRYYPQAIWQS